MSIAKPLKRKDVVCRKIGEDTVLYNAETRLVHIINSSAEKVWQLCDGKNDIDKIKKEIEAEYAVKEKDHVLKDIKNILADFKKHNLIN